MKFSKAAIVVGRRCCVASYCQHVEVAAATQARVLKFCYGHPQLDQMGRKSKRRLTNTMRRIRISK